MSECLTIEALSLVNNGQPLERINLHIALGNFSAQANLPFTQAIRIQDYNNDENLIFSFYQDEVLVSTFSASLDLFRQSKQQQNSVATQSGAENDNIVFNFNHFITLEQNLAQTIKIEDNPFENHLLIQDGSKKTDSKPSERSPNNADESLTPEMRATLYLNLLETKLSKSGAFNQDIENQFKELVLNIKNSIEEMNQSDHIENQFEIPINEKHIEYVETLQDEEKKISSVSEPGRTLKIDAAKTKDISQRLEEGQNISERYVTLEKDANYMLTIKKELSPSTLHFIEDDFTRSVIMKMALGKKKVGTCRIKNSVQISEKEETVIDKKSYFKEDCQRNFVHFFRSGSKNLYLLNVNKLIESNIENAEKIELNIDYDISPDHRSLITPNGMLYISGAIPNAKTTLHLYSFSGRTFIEKQGMQVTDRKDYGFCYMSKNLFAIGGTHKGNVTSRCERYDMAANKWIYLAPMNRALKNVNICGFNGVYIYRFFGIDSGGNVDQTIERYDAARNKWTYLNVKIHPNLFGIYDTKSVQINKDCVFIFGGQNLNGFSPKYCKGYILRVDDKREKNEAELLETKNFIPGLAGTFTQNSIISHSGEVLFLRESKF